MIILQGIISVMEDETYECFEATFYRNTLEDCMPEVVDAGIVLEDAKTLEKFLNQAMMEKEGILGIHYGSRSDGTTQTYMDYFKVDDGAAPIPAAGLVEEGGGADAENIGLNEAVEKIQEQ